MADETPKLTNKKYTPKVAADLAKVLSSVEKTEGNGRFGKNVDKSKVIAPSTPTFAPPPPVSPHPATPVYVLPDPSKVIPFMAVPPGGNTEHEGWEYNGEELVVTPYAADYFGIPNMYKGIQMRSQLEVFWAVFWDRLNIQWKYERHAIRTRNYTHRVDFYLPQFDLFVEIKGPFPAGNSVKDKCKDFARVTKKQLLLMWGLPGWWLDDKFKKGSVWTPFNENPDPDPKEQEKSSGGSILYTRARDGQIYTAIDLVFSFCPACHDAWVRPLGADVHCSQMAAKGPLMNNEYVPASITHAVRLVETYGDWNPEKETINTSKSKARKKT